MKRRHVRRRSIRAGLHRGMGIASLALLLVACAAERKSAPPSTPAADAPASAGYAQPGYPPPPPAAPNAQPGQAPQTAPTNDFAPPPPQSRSVAMSQASNDVESSQRELDVAGGDCRNACRALGSMDRAAGRLCSLAQSNDESRRCTDAKTRVYSARDKVKNTCGSCPDTSVDRSAPIPSR